MKHVGTIPLETERLLLRQYTIAEAYDYACVDSENGEVIWEAPFSKEQIVQLQKVIDQYKKDDYYYWAIIEKSTDKIIGGILTVCANEKMLSCEMGYAINPKFRNIGYASEALKRVLEFLLIEVEYNRVQAGHLADNPASGKVMEKAGMKYEGTLRQDNRNHEGILTDSKVYGILREDLIH
jgi:[ribosomal protein S5]-alanine N-acetyltransferase